MADRRAELARLLADAPAELLRMLAYAPEERRRRAAALDDARTWVDPRGWRLSDRVWLARSTVRAAIDDALREAIRDGLPAAEVADRLERFLRPRARLVRTATGVNPRYQGAGSYSGRRLVRTEVSRAHAAATVQSAQVLGPLAQGLRFQLSPSHVRADRCDPLADHDEGLGRGVYPVDAFPAPPRHPHCLCCASVVVVPRDEAVAVIRARYGLGEPVGVAA